MDKLFASEQQTECEMLTQKFSGVRRIIGAMHIQTADFLKSPSTQPLPNLEDLTAGFENDLYEYRHIFVNSAAHLVTDYLDRHNTGPWALGGRLEDEDTDGRLTFFGRIDIQDESVTYFPALIKKIRGGIHLGAGISEVQYLEEIRGSMSAASKKEFRANRLKKVYDAQINAEKEVELGALQTAENLSFECESVLLPSLEKAKIIKMSFRKKGGRLELPELKVVASISTLFSEEVKIPKVTEIFKLVATSATTIVADELQLINGYLDISSLDPATSFRSVFKNLTEVWEDEGISIFVKDEQRKREIEGLIGPGLAVHGVIEKRSARKI